MARLRVRNSHTRGTTFRCFQFFPPRSTFRSLILTRCLPYDFQYYRTNCEAVASCNVMGHMRLTNSGADVNLHITKLNVEFGSSPSKSYPDSSHPVYCARCRGLTFTSARVLVGARVDGPGNPPSDTVDFTLSVYPVLSCPLRPVSTTACLCHGQESGLSPWARTCSRTWTLFLQRLHIKAQFPLLKNLHTRNLDPKFGDNLPSDMTVLGEC